MRKSIASPCSWQPKHRKACVEAFTVNEGVFSWWKGQSPFILVPPAGRRVTYSPTRATMSVASRTSAIDSSRIRPATVLHPYPSHTPRAAGTTRARAERRWGKDRLRALRNCTHRSAQPRPLAEASSGSGSQCIERMFDLEAGTWPAARLLGPAELEDGDAEHDEPHGGDDRQLEQGRDPPAAPGHPVVERGPHDRADVEVGEDRVPHRVDG